jgi:hypothetical protein
MSSTTSPSPSSSHGNLLPPREFFPLFSRCCLLLCFSYCLATQLACSGLACLSLNVAFFNHGLELVGSFSEHELVDALDLSMRWRHPDHAANLDACPFHACFSLTELLVSH